MDTPAHRSFLKGLALHGLGRKKGAREAWRYALQKDKGHRGARRFIEEVR